MPLNTYPILKDDTRLILHKDTVYKVKVKYIDREVIKNVNIPFTEQAAHHQIEQVLRAVFYADERNSGLGPILTEHFQITPVKVPWKAASHFGFKKDDTVLKTFPFVFEIVVRVRDEIVENVKNATNKSAVIQQTSKRDDKDDKFDQRRSIKNRVEKQPNSDIVEDGSFKAEPSTSSAALVRDEIGRFHRMIDGNRNMSPQEQLTTTECVKKYKEILKKAQSQKGTQKNSADQEMHFCSTTEVAVSPSNLESQGGSEIMKPSSQMKSSQSPYRREITPQKRKSERIHMPPKMRDDVNENIIVRKKPHKIKLLDISKGDADFQLEQGKKLRLSRKRNFDEKITENEKARSISMYKSKRTYQSSRTSGTENLTSVSVTNSEQEQHISKRLRSADTIEKHSLPFKMNHGNEISERDQVLVGVSNNQIELHRHKTKSFQNRSHIKTDSSTGKSVAREDMKKKRKDNSGVQRKMSLKDISDSAQRIQTRSQRIGELKKVKVKKHISLNPLHKSKTQSRSEEANTFSFGLHRCDEDIKAQSIISPRISHVRPFKPPKSAEKQNPTGSPLRNARNLDRQVLDENLNPSTSEQAQGAQSQERQIGDETDRLLNLSLRNPRERRISSRRSLDRYMIEREELEETLKLQQLAQSTSPRRSPRQSAKVNTASSRQRSGLWDMMDNFLTPVKKFFKSE